MSVSGVAEEFLRQGNKSASIGHNFKSFRMFSDDEDFDINLSDVDSSPEKNVVKKNGSEEEQFHELMGRYEEMKKRMDDVDELARQVKFAMELQKQMSDCYSNRITSFPIETGMELRCLASGSLMLLFTIYNKTSNDLRGWSISASLSPTMATTASTCSSLSQRIALQTLAPGEEFSSELFVAQQHLRLPLAVRMNLIRNFNIAGEEKFVVIELDSAYLSLRDLLFPSQSAPQQGQDKSRATIIGGFLLKIPCALIDLLSGCPDDNDPVNVLRIILPQHRFSSLAPGSYSISVVLVENPFDKHSVHIEILRESNSFVAHVNLRDASLRNRLRESLQLHIIHLSLRVKKRPSNSVSIVNDGHTVDELYESVISSFL